MNKVTERRWQIDSSNVPEPFRPLIPYAEKWGFNYTYVSKLMEKTPVEELRETVKTVSEFDADGFDEWLGNPGKGNGTKEWRAFGLLIDACDVVKIRMEQNRLPPDKNE
jgi:hypothetical protein